MPKKSLFWGHSGAVQFGLVLSQCVERLGQQRVPVSGCKPSKPSAWIIPILPVTASSPERWLQL